MNETISSINIKNHLYKYIIIFMIVFSIGFSTLHVIKADGGSLVYNNYTIKWVYDINQTENALISDMFYIDLTISFDDYYSGYIYLYHTSYLPAYICVGGQIDSNTNSSLRVQFTNVNQIYMKFVFNEDECAELKSGFTKNDWLDGSMFTFNSSTSSISLGTRPADILSEIEDVNTTLTSTSTNISTMTSKLNQLFNYITALYSNSNNIMSTLGTISSNIDNVETYLSSLITTSEDTNAVVDEILTYVDGLENYCSQILDDTNTLVTDVTDIQTNISTMTSKLNQLYNYITALYTNSNTIISKLNDVNSNLNSIITQLSSMDLSISNNEYINRALYDSYNYMIQDISNIDTTILLTNAYNGQTLSIDGLFDYDYIILYSYLSAGNFNYFVIDLTSGYQASNTYHWISTDYFYSLSFIVSTANTFYYSLERYSFSTGETEDMNSSVYISVIYGTNDNPFNNITDVSSLENKIDTTNDYLSDILDAINNLDITEDQSTTIVNNYENIENNNNTINNNLPDIEDISLPSLDLETISIPNIMTGIAEDLQSVSENIILPVYEGIILPSGFDWIIKIGLMGIIIMGIRRLFK